MPRQDKDGAVAGDKRRFRVDMNLFDRPNDGERGAWTWGQLRPGLLTSCMDVINLHGDAISFATNKAHTAGSITLLTGGDRPRKWVNTYDEAEYLLDALYADYSARPIE